LFTLLNPEPKPTRLEDLDPVGQKFKPAFKPIEIKEVCSAIDEIKLPKSCGPSGLGPAHLKFIKKERKDFIEKLTQIFNYILNFPELIIKKVPLLYKFRAIFIKKEDSTKYRPISIAETLLLAFHKILKRRLNE
jgi:hypothetical protein